jgi:hypothetical protein
MHCGSFFHNEEQVADFKTAGSNLSYYRYWFAGDIQSLESRSLIFFEPLCSTGISYLKRINMTFIFQLCSAVPGRYACWCLHNGYHGPWRENQVPFTGRYFGFMK